MDDEREDMEMSSTLQLPYALSQASFYWKQQQPKEDWTSTRAQSSQLFLAGITVPEGLLPNPAEFEADWDWDRKGKNSLTSPLFHTHIFSEPSTGNEVSDLYNEDGRGCPQTAPGTAILGSFYVDWPIVIGYENVYSTLQIGRITFYGFLKGLLMFIFWVCDMYSNFQLEVPLDELESLIFYVFPAMNWSEQVRFTFP